MHASKPRLTTVRRSMSRRGNGLVTIAALSLVAVIGAALSGCAREQAHAQSSPSAAVSHTAEHTGGPVSPASNPGGNVDAAAKAKAKAWLAAAVVPPSFAESRVRPTGVASSAGTGLWCEPMATAVSYWTAPATSASSALTWLEQNASRGMRVTSVSGDPTAGDSAERGGTVVDERPSDSGEALIFSVTSIGSGSGIRADAFTMAENSKCASAPAGTTLGIGG
jgi:hypothetical protein